MSKTLLINLDKIKNQKDTFLIPENIKQGVSIFGVEGSLENPFKEFSSIEEMHAYENPENNMHAAIYNYDAWWDINDVKLEYYTKLSFVPEVGLGDDPFENNTEFNSISIFEDEDHNNYGTIITTYNNIQAEITMENKRWNINWNRIETPEEEQEWTHGGKWLRTSITETDLISNEIIYIEGDVVEFPTAIKMTYSSGDVGLWNIPCSFILAPLKQYSAFYKYVWGEWISIGDTSSIKRHDNIDQMYSSEANPDDIAVIYSADNVIAAESYPIYTTFEKVVIPKAVMMDGLPVEEKQFKARYPIYAMPLDIEIGYIDVDLTLITPEINIELGYYEVDQESYEFIKSNIYNIKYTCEDVVEQIDGTKTVFWNVIESTQGDEKTSFELPDEGLFLDYSQCPISFGMQENSFDYDYGYNVIMQVKSVYGGTYKFHAIDQYWERLDNISAKVYASYDEMMSEKDDETKITSGNYAIICNNIGGHPYIDKEDPNIFPFISFGFDLWSDSPENLQQLVSLEVNQIFNSEDENEYIKITKQANSINVQVEFHSALRSEDVLISYRIEETEIIKETELDTFDITFASPIDFKAYKDIDNFEIICQVLWTYGYAFEGLYYLNYDLYRNETFYTKLIDINDIKFKVDTSDANLTADLMPVNRTAYVNGEKLTGTLPLWYNFGYIPETVAYEPFSSTDTTTYLTFTATSTKKFITHPDVDMTIKFRISDETKLAEAVGLTSDKLLEGNTVLGIEGTRQSASNWILAPDLTESGVERYFATNSNAYARRAGIDEASYLVIEPKQISCTGSMTTIGGSVYNTSETDITEAFTAKLNIEFANGTSMQIGVVINKVVAGSSTSFQANATANLINYRDGIIGLYISLT